MKLAKLKTPFRWYTDPDDKLREDPNANMRYKLITPSTRMLSFMIKVLRDNDEYHWPDSWKIYTESGVEVADLSQDDFMLNNLDYYRYNEYDYLVYKGQDMGLDLDGGFYYSVITMQDSNIRLYSEDFWIDCEVDGRAIEFGDDFNEDFNQVIISGGIKKYSKLEWWHPCDIGDILYQTGYHNELFLPGEIVKADPQITEEGSEDGQGNLVITSISISDVIQMIEYLPEYIVDALEILRMHKSIFITQKNNLFVGQLKTPSVTRQYLNLCFARVDINGRLETNFIRGSCCNNLPIENYYRCNINMGYPRIGETPGYAGPGWSIDVDVQFDDQTGNGSGKVFLSLSTVDGGIAFELNDPYKYTFIIPPEGGTVLGRFEPRCTAGGRTVIADGLARDFTVKRTPCDAPIGLYTSEPGTNQGRLTWDINQSGEPIMDYEVRIMQGGILLDGFPLSVTGNTYLFTGLQSGSNYQVSVRRLCQPGQYGPWADDIDINTWNP